MKDIKLPFLIDGDSGKPSVTLMFAYISFVIACVVVAYLTYKDATAGSVGALTLFFGSLVIYRLRAIDKLKFSLKEQSFEIEDTPDTKEENEK